MIRWHNIFEIPPPKNILRYVKLEHQNCTHENRDLSPFSSTKFSLSSLPMQRRNIDGAVQQYSNPMDWSCYMSFLQNQGNPPQDLVTPKFQITLHIGKIHYLRNPGWELVTPKKRSLPDRFWARPGCQKTFPVALFLLKFITWRIALFGTWLAT